MLRHQQTTANKFIDKQKEKNLALLTGFFSIIIYSVSLTLQKVVNFILPPEEASVRLGKWGMLHKDYLLKNKKVLFTTLLTQGKLYQHCAEVETQARDMFDTLFDQMKNAEGVTEQLKEENQFEWVCRMQNINARVRKIINNEIIFK